MLSNRTLYGCGCGSGNFDEGHPSGAEARIDFKRFAARLYSQQINTDTFSESSRLMEYGT